MRTRQQIADELAAAARQIAPGGRLLDFDVKLVDGLAASFHRREVAEVTAAAALTDKAAFFAAVRRSFGALDQKQVAGFEAVLTALAGWPLAWTAAALATAWLETARTMQPVREAYWLSEEWRKRNLRYFPHYGRGYVQLTWPANYAKADRELELGGRLVAHLDLAMDPGIAARIMRRGMEEGWFTGRKLADYLPAAGPGARAQFKASRKIINGTDRDDDLADMAMQFQAALQAGGMR
jgi:putative chitinase